MQSQPLHPADRLHESHSEVALIVQMSPLGTMPDFLFPNPNSELNALSLKRVFEKL